MYSTAKIHYTTITMNKEGAARFVKKKKISFIYCNIPISTALAASYLAGSLR